MPDIHPVLIPSASSGSSWVKSSYSNAGQNCVEVAGLAPRSQRVAVRDSKQSNGPTFTVPTTAWASFIREIQTDQHRPA
ncbi:DUF397 domain-containing protein [Streptomyces olivoreticuli]|uniref:DUF397 domain-containing protein n=1 Tax=Streptomyces olivoreticuli TaxID=68246 RepID=UPI000E28405C|nr:DUF397 domain-containing protein [Streptomyces olivoreticuli]